MTLYQITARYLDVLDAADLDPDSIEPILDSIQDDLQSKVANGIAILQELKRRSEAIDAELTRLSQLKKDVDHSIARIRNYYAANLSSVGIKKVQTDLGNMTVARAKPKLIIDDEEKVPLQFKRFVTTAVIDKDMLRARLERGEVEGAHLGEPTIFIRIN